MSLKNPYTGFKIRMEKMLICKISSKKILLISIIMVAIMIVFHNSFAEETPSYSFVSFEKNYNRILNSGQSEGFQIKEEEINSAFGKYSIFMEKAQKLYAENVYLFFNEKKELIFFTIRFKLNENYSKQIIEKLVTSIGEKFVEKYGSNERESVPYYKIVENQYEIFLRPNQPASNTANVSFKYLDRYSGYLEFYKLEIEKVENEEIAKTVDNF